MIEQVHAEMGKELIRVNITIETDEDDLLGGFRLVNGETKFVLAQLSRQWNVVVLCFLMSVTWVQTS